MHQCMALFSFLYSIRLSYSIITHSYSFIHLFFSCHFFLSSILFLLFLTRLFAMIFFCSPFSILSFFHYFKTLFSPCHPSSPFFMIFLVAFFYSFSTFLSLILLLYIHNGFPTLHSPLFSYFHFCVISYSPFSIFFPTFI